MKTFVVLGIGSAQADLLRHLKGGFRVLACANTPNGPGLHLCDRFEPIDITDTQGVIDFCRRQKADYVYSIGSEAAMPTVARASEALGLPCFVSPETAMACSDKHLLRQRLQGAYGSIDYQVIRSPDDPVTLAFPVVIKPVDAQGQRGVHLVRTPLEAPAACQDALRHSKSRTLIAETYVNGPEISVNAFVRGSAIETAVFTNRVSWPGFAGGLIHKHELPCTISDRARANTLKLVGETISALEITEGPVYFQIKMQGDAPRLIEVTPRLDGCHLWRMIRYAYGIDLLERTIAMLTRQPGTPARTTASPGRWVLEFFCSPPGAVFDPDDCPPHPESVYTAHYYTPGQIVGTINGRMEKCGYQVYRG